MLPESYSNSDWEFFFCHKLCMQYTEENKLRKLTHIFGCYTWNSDNIAAHVSFRLYIKLIYLNFRSASLSVVLRWLRDTQVCLLVEANERVNFTFDRGFNCYVFAYLAFCMISNKNEQWSKVGAIAACRLTCYNELLMLCKVRRYGTSIRGRAKPIQIRCEWKRIFGI